MSLQTTTFASRGEIGAVHEQRIQELMEAKISCTVHTDMADVDRLSLLQQISFYNPPALVLFDKLRYYKSLNGSEQGQPAYGRTNECLNWNWLFEKCQRIAIVYFSQLKLSDPQFEQEKQTISLFWQSGWSMLSAPYYQDFTKEVINPGYDSYRMREYKIIHIGSDQATLSNEQKEDLAFVRQAVNPMWAIISVIWVSLMKLYRQAWNIGAVYS